MKKLLLLLCALLTLGGSTAWATDVTVIDKSSAPTTYGALSGTTFTTNAASGMAGVTVDGIKGTTTTSFAYGACLAFTSTASGTVTMTAPTGYIITGYRLTARSNTYSVSYTLTPSAGGSAVQTSTGGVDLETSGLTAQTASFTYSAASANSFYIPSLVITVVDASAPTVNVTYNLYESDGTTLVNSVVAVQEANSAVSVPSSLTGYTYYDYATSGTIGESDCAITVIRTLKSGVVISNSNLSNTKCYNITTNGRGAWVVPNEATAVTSTTNAGLAFLASDTKQQFAFILYEGNYYLYSVSQSKFISKSGNYTTLTEEPGNNVTLLTSTGSFSYPVVVAFQNGSYHAGISNGYNPAVITHYNSLSDDGNRAYITEAGDFDPTAALAALDEYFHPSYTVTYKVQDEGGNILFTSGPVGTTLGANITTLPAEYQLTDFYDYNTIDVTVSGTSTIALFTATLKTTPIFKFTADTSAPVWHKLKMKNANYPTYVAGGTPNVTLPTTDADDETVQWAFIGNPYAGFQIINRAAGTGLVLGSASPNGDGNTGGATYATLGTSGSQAYETWYPAKSTHFTNGFFLQTSEGYALNQRSTANLAYWTGGKDAGSTFVAEEILEGQDLYEYLLAQVEAINYGSGLGQYTLTGALAPHVGNEAALIAMIKGTYGDAANYTDGAAALQQMLDLSALNMPAPNTFLRIRSILGDKAYLTAPAVDGRATFTSATDNSTVFFLTEDNYLVSLATGLGFKNVYNGAADIKASGITGNVFNIVEAVSGNVGQYSIGTTYNGNPNYLYSTGANNSNADRNTYSAGWVNNNSFTLEAADVNTLSVSISGAGYATYCAPVALTIPTGVTAYTGKVNGDYLTLTALDVAIPANTPVVLAGNEGAYDFGVTSGVDAVANNELVGVTVAQAVTNALTLQKIDGKVGFYGYTGATLAGFKAYLPNSAGVKGLTLSFDNETAVQGVNAELPTSRVIYNLAGQRVQKAQKGIYVVNGKKVVIK